MKTFIPLRHHRPYVTVALAAALTIASLLLLFAPSAQSQPAPIATKRIDTIRGQIKEATGHHDPPEQLGLLWLQLADRYQDTLDFPQSEDAYTHALQLLQLPATRLSYADALDGLGSLYLATARFPESLASLQKALDIYQSAGDRPRAATLHEGIALTLLFEGHLRDSSAEAAVALEQLRTLAQPDPREIVATLLTRGYSLCLQGQCQAAVEDTSAAITLARSNFAANSLELAASWTAQGFVQWKSGSASDGEKSIQQAIQILHDQPTLPRPVVASAQLGVLGQYANLLKETHRKSEAKQVESEIAQLKQELRSGCNQCTVNASLFSPQPLAP